MQQRCRRSGKMKHSMKLSLPPKLNGKKLVWVPVISFCKLFTPNYAFDALLYQNWLFSPPNRLTLRITLICGFFKAKVLILGIFLPPCFSLSKVHGKLDMLAIYNWSIEYHHPPLWGGAVGPPLKERPLSFTNP